MSRYCPHFYAHGIRFPEGRVYVLVDGKMRKLTSRRRESRPERDEITLTELRNLHAEKGAETYKTFYRQMCEVPIDWENPTHVRYTKVDIPIQLEPQACVGRAGRRVYDKAGLGDGNETRRYVPGPEQNMSEQTNELIARIVREGAGKGTGATSPDERLEMLLAERGFDGLPGVVETVEELPEGQPIFYRGVAEGSQAKDFVSGDYFVGTGNYGNGVYATTRKETATTRADGGLITFALRPGARTISYDDAMVLAEELQKGAPQDGSWNFPEDPIQNFAGSPSNAAALFGYDAIIVEGDTGPGSVRTYIEGDENYLVLLNRTAVIAVDPEAAKQPENGSGLEKRTNRAEQWLDGALADLSGRRDISEGTSENLGLALLGELAQNTPKTLSGDPEYVADIAAVLQPRLVDAINTALAQPTLNAGEPWRAEAVVNLSALRTAAAGLATVGFEFPVGTGVPTKKTMPVSAQATAADYATIACRALLANGDKLDPLVLDAVGKRLDHAESLAVSLTARWNPETVDADVDAIVEGYYPVSDIELHPNDKRGVGRLTHRSRCLGALAEAVEGKSPRDAIAIAGAWAVTGTATVDPTQNEPREIWRRNEEHTGWKLTRDSRTNDTIYPAGMDPRHPRVGSSHNFNNGFSGALGHGHLNQSRQLLDEQSIRVEYAGGLANLLAGIGASAGGRDVLGYTPVAVVENSTRPADAMAALRHAPVAVAAPSTQRDGSRHYTVAALPKSHPLYGAASALNELEREHAKTGGVARRWNVEGAVLQCSGGSFIPPIDVVAVVAANT